MNKQQTLIADGIVKEIVNRLTFLKNVGLDYLNLNRSASTLSGGESQRVKLAAELSKTVAYHEENQDRNEGYHKLD